MSDRINIEFAKQLLVALHGLDENLGRLDSFCSKLQAGAEKDELITIIGSFMDHVTHELMIPIYREHRSLGRPSEPGEWLQQAQQSKK